MFCVIYRFKVKAGETERFTEAWSTVTRTFKEHCGALGSRLHASDSGEFIAYAQWPSREVRDAAQLPESVQTDAAAVMRGCCESIETLYELTPAVDLLVLVEAIAP